MLYMKYTLVRREKSERVRDGEGVGWGGKVASSRDGEGSVCEVCVCLVNVLSGS